MYQLQKLLSCSGIDFNAKQDHDFQKYIKLLVSWNKRINLISRNDEARIIENHILESLAFLLSFKIQPSERIIDVGSGAGFPALPISMICPDVNFVLVESKRLKVLFLKEVIAQLQLTNVNVFCDRIENISKDSKNYQQFDFVSSRAVASLREVYNWVFDLIKLRGFYVAWKGGDVQQEIYDLKQEFENANVDIINMDARLVDANKEKVFVRVQKVTSNEEE